MNDSLLQQSVTFFSRRADQWLKSLASKILDPSAKEGDSVFEALADAELWSLAEFQDQALLPYLFSPHLVASVKGCARNLYASRQTKKEIQALDRQVCASCGN